jgi:hypothetical protein
LRFAVPGYPARISLHYVVMIPRAATRAGFLSARFGASNVLLRRANPLIVLNAVISGFVAKVLKRLTTVQLPKLHTRVRFPSPAPKPTEFRQSAWVPSKSAPPYLGKTKGCGPRPLLFPISRGAPLGTNAGEVPSKHCRSPAPTVYSRGRTFEVIALRSHHADVRLRLRFAFTRFLPCVCLRS